MSDPLEFEARAAGIPPLLEGHEPEPRHVVQGHVRHLPPKMPSSPDPNVPTLDLELPDPVQLPIREIPVRRHLRRNPRHKEPEMTLEHEDRVLAHALAQEHGEAAQRRVPSTTHDFQAWAQAARDLGHPERCPDDGTCHHECELAACFRVLYAAPLSITGWTDWPGLIRLAAANDEIVLEERDREREFPKEARGEPIHDGDDPEADQAYRDSFAPGGSRYVGLPEGQAHARPTDPTTSHLAAAEVATKPSQIEVLRMFQRSPDLGLADHELVRLMELVSRFSPSRIRSARAELQAAGLVSTVGRTTTPYGRAADVHALTDRGRSVTLPPAPDLRTD